MTLKSFGEREGGFWTRRNGFGETRKNQDGLVWFVNELKNKKGSFFPIFRRNRDVEGPGQIKNYLRKGLCDQDTKVEGDQWLGANWERYHTESWQSVESHPLTGQVDKSSIWDVPVPGWDCTIVQESWVVPRDGVPAGSHLHLSLKCQGREGQVWVPEWLQEDCHMIISFPDLRFPYLGRQLLYQVLPGGGTKAIKPCKDKRGDLPPLFVTSLRDRSSQ